MRRHAPSVLWTLGLAALLLLCAAGSSWAHPTAEPWSAHEALDDRVDAPPLAPDGARDVTLRAAPEAPSVPWAALLGALVAIGLARRRPRRAIALAVVLLLALFAFEEGLHSAHHMTGQPTKVLTCPVAVAGAHLSAVEVDGTAPLRAIVLVVAMATEPPPAVLVARFLAPDQGRSPPRPTA